MSFHGGLIGVIPAMLWFARRTKRTFFRVSDFIAPLVPFGLGAGRLGNFINGELWGRVTLDTPRAMLFRAPAVRICSWRRPTHSGRRCITILACCRAIRRSCMSCYWKGSYCLLS